MAGAEVEATSLQLKSKALSGQLLMVPSTHLLSLVHAHSAQMCSSNTAVGKV